MAPEDDHPEVGLLHEGEAEEADAGGDVEDIVMEVPVQPGASASSSSAVPQRSSLHLSGALRSTSSTAWAPAVVSSRNRRLELTRETAYFAVHARAQLLDVARSHGAMTPPHQATRPMLFPTQVSSTISEVALFFKRFLVELGHVQKLVELMRTIQFIFHLL